MAFRNDLLTGQKKEIEFTSVLNNKGWTTTTTADTIGKFSGYDVEAKLGTTTVTFEIKFDRMASWSGNVALEMCRRGFNDKKIPSGLTTSAADYYIFCIDNDASFYQIKLDHLKDLVREKKYHSGMWGGDFQQSGIVLFNRNFLLSQCEKINEECG